MVSNIEWWKGFVVIWVETNSIIVLLDLIFLSDEMESNDRIERIMDRVAPAIGKNLVSRKLNWQNYSAICCGGMWMNFPRIDCFVLFTILHLIYFRQSFQCVWWIMVKSSIRQWLIIRKRFILLLRLAVLLVIVVWILFVFYSSDYYQNGPAKLASKPSPYVVVMTICGEESFHQGIVALKSALIFSANDTLRPYHFIVMTDPEMMANISDAVIYFKVLFLKM